MYSAHSTDLESNLAPVTTGSRPPVRPGRSFWAGTGETLGLALPLMAAQVSVVGMGLADTATFGFIGTAALAGGGLGAIVLTFFSIIAIGILAATSIQVAYASTANRGAIPGIVAAGFVVALAVGLLLWAVVADTGPALLRLGQDSGTVADAGKYLSFAAPAILPNLIFTVLRGLAVGLGRSRPVGVITVASLLVKALLNVAILVGLHLSGPGDHTAAGLKLAGAADTLTYALMALMLWLYCRKHLGGYLSRPRLPTLRSAALREALWLGLPIGFTLGVEAGLFDGVGLIVGRFGPLALAANAIALQCISLTFMLANGLSQAATVRVGRSAGAGDIAEARRVGRQALVIGLGIMSGSAAIFGVFGREVATLLAGDGTASPTVVDLATRLLLVACFFQWFDGTQNIAIGCLRGLKETRLPIIAALFGYWVIGLPAAWLLSTTTSLGPAGAWWGMGVGLATAATMLVLRFETATAVRPAAAAQDQPTQ